VTVTLCCQGETLRARGRRTLQEGWRAAYGSVSLEDEDGDEEDGRIQDLPLLNQGTKVRLAQARVKEGQTKPPARYTEAALLSAMEHPGSQLEDRGLSKTLEETGGLGTPATRADIIEKLISAFYVERNGKTLIPTAKGLQVVQLAPEELRSPELTARWELRLSEIAAGRQRPEGFIREMREYAGKLVNEVKASDKQYRHDNVSRERCPDCGQFLLEVKGKKGGKLLVCPDRNCGYRKNLSVQTNARCPNCHKRMELRGQAPGKGEEDKRLFVCVCGYRERMADFEKRRTGGDGANKRDVQRYLASQPAQGGNTALAEALKKWQEQSGK
jgi:DNA topoisomerase-3